MPNFHYIEILTQVDDPEQLVFRYTTFTAENKQRASVLGVSKSLRRPHEQYIKSIVIPSPSEQALAVDDSEDIVSAYVEGARSVDPDDSAERLWHDDDQPTRTTVAIEVDDYGIGAEPRFSLLHIELETLLALWRSQLLEEESHANSSALEFARNRADQIATLLTSLPAPNPTQRLETEVPKIVPVRYELQELAKYWQKQALGEEFDFHFIGGTAGTGIESYIAFAYRRVSRIATLVGDDVVRRATHIAREEFGRGIYTPRYWDIFQYGNHAQWKAVQDEVQRGPSTGDAPPPSE